MQEREERDLRLPFPASSFLLFNTYRPLFFLSLLLLSSFPPLLSILSYPSSYQIISVAILADSKQRGMPPPGWTLPPTK